nr:unnamed protein product [Callosobruchus analis]
MEGLFYGLTRMDLRRLAYQVAVQNNIENPFREGVAGRYWLKGFLKWHQNILSVRQPTGTSYARERMNQFYDNLETIQSTTSFPPSRIFNVDETGLSIVQSKTAKVIAHYVAAAIEQEENEDPNISNVQGVPVPAVQPLLHSDNPDDVQPRPSSATSNKCLVTPYDISPVPQPKKRTSNKGRKPTKSAIISSSSYKKDLEEAQAKRSKQTKNGDKKKAIKKRTVTRKRNRRDMPTNTADIQIPTEGDAECFFCDGKYSEDREGEEWVKCLMCEMWAHSACAGYDYEFYLGFVVLTYIIVQNIIKLFFIVRTELFKYYRVKL